jgi:hypothetical protein
MKHHLNYSKEDPNYILLEKIFKIINTTIEFVVSELKKDKTLRKFFKIDSEVPTAIQVSEFISRFKPDTYIKITNSILMQTKPLKRRGKLTFIVDATLVDLDYNTKRKHRSKKHLRKQSLKWRYASFYGFYIRFKSP